MNIQKLLALFVLFFLFSGYIAHANTNVFITKVSSPSGPLDTHVYLSEAGIGTILIRTPYLELNPYSHIISLWKEQGFHVVIQAIAGTGQSAGDFKYLSTDEIADAFSTLDWITNQPFYNGTVVLFGESYDGYLALAGGLTQHSSIKAVVAASAPTDLNNDAFTSGGMIEYYLLKYYLDVSSSNRLPKRTFEKQIGKLYKQGLDFKEYDDFFRKGGIDDWDQILAEAANMEFVNRGVYDRLNEIEVPVLLMAGEIYDQDATDALHAFLKRQKTFSGKNLQCMTKLAIGPWPHGTQTTLSKSVATHFVEKALSKQIKCDFKHQIEYIENTNTIMNPNKIGKSLTPDIFNLFFAIFSKDQVEFGLNYNGSLLNINDTLLLPQVCEPWIHVSPGIERPFITVPIQKDIHLVGPIEVKNTLIPQSEAPIDLSMEILVSRKNGGWSSIDEHHNMYRTRKRIKGPATIPLEVTYQTPFLSLNLKKGDSLIVSFQRPHHSVSKCSDEKIHWLINDQHPMKISFPFNVQ